MNTVEKLTEKELMLEYSLLRIDNEHTKILLNSCETALSERDKQIMILNRRIEELEEKLLYCRN